MRKIGFSHGCAFKLTDPYAESNINVFKSCGCNAIEINCHSVRELEKFDGLMGILDDFEYKSIHLPVGMKYKNDRATHSVLESIASYYKKIGASLAVVHPDLVDDWRIFDRYASVAWAIENMDDRKKTFKGADDLKRFFTNHENWHLVLDVGHCNANDKSMALADCLISEFKNRIKEMHLSGYTTFHDPLYRTEQVEIIERCKNLDVPIIIESTFEQLDGIEGVSKEFKYILKHLNTPPITSSH